MKINTILSERAIIQEQMLNDSVYKEFYKLGILLKEYKMSQQDVQNLFRQVASGAAAGGNVAQAGDAPASNRTVIGKGADVAGEVKKAFDSVASYIGKTGVVKGADRTFDAAQQKIMGAVGNDSKIAQSLEWYRELSKVPGMGLAAKTIIVGLAGLSGAGLGAVAIAAGITFVNQILQGNKFSSAVWESLKTAGLVGAIQVAKDLLSTTHVGADYGNADDQSFGPIDKSNPDPLDSNGDNTWNNALPNADAASNSQADLQAAEDWLNADAAGRAEIEQVTGLSADKLERLANGEYSDAATTAYNQNPDPSTGLPLDPNSTRADYTAPDDIGSATEYKVTAADGKLGVGGIAQKYPGISAQDIIDYNNLSPDGLIKPGQVLQIPEPNVVSPSSTNIWDRYEGPGPKDMDAVSDRSNNLFKMQQDADTEFYKNKPDDFGVPPRSNDAVGDGMPKTQPVTPGTPSDGSYRQSAPLGPDGKPMKQMASKINTGNMIREYIDIDTTARMWMLRESIGKQRGGVYLTNEGVRAVFKEVARRSAVNEGPWLDKLKGFNRKASDVIGKVTKPLGDIARAGWDSASNKITYGDLDMNWRRSAKLDQEESVDSEQVKQFLKAQGVKDPLIDASFKALGLDKGTPATPVEPAATPTEPTTAKTAEPTTAKTAAEPTANKNAGVGFNASNVMNLPGMEKYAKQPSWADPKSKDYVGRREVTRRQQAQTTAKPVTATGTNATPTSAPNPFGQMANTMRTYAPPETTSTGGTLTQTPTGQVHRASATNPNAQPAQGTELDLDQLKAQRAAKQAQGQADQQAAMAQMKAKSAADASAPTWTGRQKVSASKINRGKPVFESKVDFSLILVNKMLGERK